MSRYMPVLVRLEDVERVTRLLRELEESRPADEDPAVDLTRPRAASPAQTSATVGVDTARPPELVDVPTWSVEDLRRLAEGTTATTRRWTLALDVCAAEPETYLQTSEIARRSGMSVAEWRDAPRKITRHMRANYPDVPKDENGDAIWPLHAKTLPEHRNEVSWAITQEMAELWKQVRA